MNIYQLLNENKDSLSKLARNGINPTWVKYLDVWDDYQRLVKEKHKKTYIYYYLSDVYKTHMRNIQKILRKLEATVL